MEEESGALEVDDAGAESSDSPPEVSTLLSHFCSPKNFHTFTNSPALSHFCIFIDPLVSRLIVLQRWADSFSHFWSPKKLLRFHQKTFALSPIEVRLPSPLSHFYIVIDPTRLIVLQMWDCHTFSLSLTWNFRTFTFLLNQLRGKTINN